MSELSFPFVSAGVVVMLAAAALAAVQRTPGRARVWAAAGGAGALLLFLLAAWQVTRAGQGHLREPWLPLGFGADGLNALPLVLMAALALLSVLLTPRRDAQGLPLAGLLVIAAASSLAYAADHLGWVVAGWWGTCLPGWLGWFGPRRDRLALAIQLLGCLVLTLAVAFTGFDALDFSHADRVGFGLLLAAVVLRKGIFPAHSWVLNAYEHGPLLPNALLFNGHLGALLILRAESTPLESAAQQALDLLAIGALLTALYASVLAIAEQRPRRVLALLSVSQAAFILAGLGSRNVEGITGALVHWMVVAVATTGLVCVLRALEVRCAAVGQTDAPLGLAARAPRLAVFFLVCGLALVGLPGTLGYCAEDMLFHGALASHPFLGIALLVATALNAIHLLRLYSRLFLGRQVRDVAEVPDALPRERWALTACLVFLEAGGLVPAVVTHWRAPVAERLSQSLGGGHGH